ncbi:MAG: hypothetical protein GY804_05010 [Alphaproteobacteria bacterium]|nr:hypothetical protein [Alphaproteobacteria bacterium]
MREFLSGLCPVQSIMSKWQDRQDRKKVAQDREQDIRNGNVVKFIEGDETHVIPATDAKDFDFRGEKIITYVPDGMNFKTAKFGFVEGNRYSYTRFACNLTDVKFGKDCEINGLEVESSKNIYGNEQCLIWSGVVIDSEGGKSGVLSEEYNFKNIHFTNVILERCKLSNVEACFIDNVESRGSEFKNLSVARFNQFTAKYIKFEEERVSGRRETAFSGLMKDVIIGSKPDFFSDKVSTINDPDFCNLDPKSTVTIQHAKLSSQYSADWHLSSVAERVSENEGVTIGEEVYVADLSPKGKLLSNNFDEGAGLIMFNEERLVKSKEKGD